MADQERIGTVDHYYQEIDVAVFAVEEGELRVGDVVRVVGGEDDFTFTVESMEVDHEKVDRVGPGQEAGVKVPQKAWPNADVFKVTGEEGDEEGDEEE